MATEKQKEAARENLGKARQAQSDRAHGEDVPRQGQGMSTAEQDDLTDKEFAFPAGATWPRAARTARASEPSGNRAAPELQLH
jgi:hypothetical protein